MCTQSLFSLHTLLWPPWPGLERTCLLQFVYSLRAELMTRLGEGVREALGQVLRRSSDRDPGDVQDRVGRLFRPEDRYEPHSDLGLAFAGHVALEEGRDAGGPHVHEADRSRKRVERTRSTRHDVGVDHGGLSYHGCDIHGFRHVQAPRAGARERQVDLAVGRALSEDAPRGHDPALGESCEERGLRPVGPQVRHTAGLGHSGEVAVLIEDRTALHDVPEKSFPSGVAAAFDADTRNCELSCCGGCFHAATSFLAVSGISRESGSMRMHIVTWDPTPA